MSSYIVPGTKLTSLTALNDLTDADLFYTVDAETLTSRKTSYQTLCNSIYEDITPFYGSKFFNISGGTVTNNVTLLSGVSATNYFYTSAGGLVVPQDLSSFLYLSAVQSEMSKAASKQYVIDQMALSGIITFAFLYQNFAALSGSVLTGNLSCSNYPTATAAYVNVNYVNSQFMPLSGGTFSGFVAVPQPAVGDPADRVATLAYVENRAFSQPGTRLHNISAFTVNRGLDPHSNSGRGNSGAYTTYIRDNDNKIRACGLFGAQTRNSGGFGFYDARINNFPPVPIEYLFNNGSEFATNVSSTGFTTYILSNSGNVYGTGDNTAGQLGTNDTKRRNTFFRISSGLGPTVNLTGVSALFVSQGNEFNKNTYNSVFALSGGNMWAWGSNRGGQLGLGSKVDQPIPVCISQLLNAGSIQSQYMLKVAAQNSDTLGYTIALDSNNVVHVCGWNGAGQLGLSAQTTGSGPTYNIAKTPIQPNITTFQTTPNWILSGVYVTPKKLLTIPVVIADTMRAEQVYTAGSNSYLLTGGRVWSCGNNSKGACGDGTAQGFFGGLIPFWQLVRVDSLSGNPLSAVQYLTTNGDPTKDGGVSVCAYLTSGELKVWGFNTSGQLGTGDFQNKTFAVSPSGAPTGIVKVKMVGQQTNTTLFVLDSAGDIYVTGNVANGIDGRGEGDVKKQNTFQKVIRPQGIKWVNFEVFMTGNMGINKTVFAQTSANELYVWGYNEFNQAGLITVPTNKSIIDIPIKVSLF